MKRIDAATRRAVRRGFDLKTVKEITAEFDTLTGKRACEEDSYTEPSNNSPLILYKGDCLKALDTIASNLIDVVVTSPPYNIGVNYGNTYKDNLKEGLYLEFIVEVVKKLDRVLKEEGSFFLNISSKATNKELEVKIIHEIIKKTPFKIQNSIIWLKSYSFNHDSRGHYKPINSERFLHNNYEMVYHLTKDKKVKLDKLSVGVPYKHKSSINRYGKGVDYRSSGNVWFIPYKTIKNSKDKTSPCPFPEELVKRCIRLHGIDKCKVVMDPFVGGGTTLNACKTLNIEGIGIEICEEQVLKIESSLNIVRKTTVI